MKINFCLKTSLMLFVFFVLNNSVFGQCGPAGLDPCIVAKAAGSAVKTVVNKATTVKKAAVKGTAKTTAKTKQTKTTKTTKTTTKSAGNDTSIYDSLSLKRKPENSSESVDLFPIQGVSLGTTTERQMQILGGKRNTFTDQSTGEERVYYTINNMNFWVRDGVADSVGIYKFMENFPAKWKLLGFDYSLSYNEGIRLLEELGYTVQRFPDLPKLEDIGKVSRLPRIIGTKNGDANVRIVMSFMLEKGKSYDSPDTLLYMLAGIQR